MRRYGRSQAHLVGHLTTLTGDQHVARKMEACVQMANKSGRWKVELSAGLPLPYRRRDITYLIDDLLPCLSHFLPDHHDTKTQNRFLR